MFVSDAHVGMLILSASHYAVFQLATMLIQTHL